LALYGFLWLFMALANKIKDTTLTLRRHHVHSSMAVIDLNLAALLLRLCSEAERMVWQAEQLDEQERLAQDWHQLLALCGFMALYGFLSLLFGSLWLSWLFMALYGFFNLKKPKIKSLALTL
jgi:hypothetical protein